MRIRNPGSATLKVSKIVNVASRALSRYQLNRQNASESNFLSWYFRKHEAIPSSGRHVHKFMSWGLKWTGHDKRQGRLFRVRILAILLSGSTFIFLSFKKVTVYVGTHTNTLMHKDNRYWTQINYTTTVHMLGYLMQSFVRNRVTVS